MERQPEHTGPSFVLWAWVHVPLRKDRLPRKRVVVEFEFPDQPQSHRRFWILAEGGDAELCESHPGFDPDLQVTARFEPATRWHVGEIEWSSAVRKGDIRVEGRRYTFEFRLEGDEWHLWGRFGDLELEEVWRRVP